MPPQVVNRQKQQLGGLFIALIGIGFTIWTWYTALHEGYYYRKASMIFPAFAIIGLGLIFFPGYTEERVARGEDISALEGWRLITPRWWGILVVGLIVGFGNYLLLTRL